MRSAIVLLISSVVIVFTMPSCCEIVQKSESHSQACQCSSVAALETILEFVYSAEELLAIFRKKNVGYDIQSVALKYERSSFYYASNQEKTISVWVIILASIQWAIGAYLLLRDAVDGVWASLPNSMQIAEKYKLNRVLIFKIKKRTNKLSPNYSKRAVCKVG